MKLSLCVNGAKTQQEDDEADSTGNSDYSVEKIAGVLEKELTKIYPQSENYELAEISVTFMKPEDIRALNREYRDVDEATDVLSFPMEIDENDNMPVLMLGDIVICPEEVERLHPELESHEAMMLMTAHSFLHLLGYDHDTEDKEAEMFSLQEEIKAKLLEAVRQ